MNPFPAQPPWFVRPRFGEVPVGSVVAYAGPLGWPDTVPPAGLPGSPPAGPPDSPPASAAMRIEAWGWTACDGRMLDVALYPELFLALGYLYGGGGDSFALPDYRGYFLRGLDGGRGADPDPGARKPPPGQGGATGGVGSTQGAALWSHTHEYAKPKPAGVATADPNGNVGTLGTAWTGPPVTVGHAPFGTSLSANETRPLNIYVNHIIKFTAALRGDWGRTS